MNKLPPWNVENPAQTAIERLMLLADEAHAAGNTPQAKAVYDSIASAQVKETHDSIVKGRLVGVDALRRVGSATANLVLTVTRKHIHDPVILAAVHDDIVEGWGALMNDPAIVGNTPAEQKALTAKPGKQR